MQTWKVGLLALPLLMCSCASWKIARVKIPTEAKSSGRIQVSAPRVYRDRNGYLVAGYLRARDCGAHFGRRGHLHVQEIDDARGTVVQDEITAAPSIRHNPRMFNETTSYTLRLGELDVHHSSLRVVLHSYSREECRGRSQLDYEKPVTE